MSFVNSCYNLLLKAKENKAVLDEIMLCFKFKAMELNKTFQNTSFISDILANKSDNDVCYHNPSPEK